MLLWYLSSEGIEKVLTEKISDGKYYISEKNITSDGSNLFRTERAAKRRFLKSLGGRSTKVPYLVVIDGLAA